MSSIRQQIFDAVLAALGDISIANGYSTDVANVFSWRETAQDPSELPALTVRDTDCGTSADDVPFGRHEHNLTVEVAAWAEGEAPETTVRAMLADVAACLWANRTWGGLARWTALDSHGLDLEQAGSTVAQGTATATITYRTALGVI